MRDPIELHLWRKPKGQSIQKIPADSAGYFELPEMNIKIAVQQQRLIFADALTGEVLRDTGQFSSALENAEHNVIFIEIMFKGKSFSKVFSRFIHYFSRFRTHTVFPKIIG